MHVKLIKKYGAKTKLYRDVKWLNRHTSITAFITIPAPFTIAIDGCCKITNKIIITHNIHFITF